MPEHPGATRRPAPRLAPRLALLGAWLLVALGAFTLLTRGVLPAADPGMSGNADWRLVYAAARAWALGAQPYDAQSVREVFSRSPGAGELDAMNTRGSTVLVYPPPALAAYAPLALLPWSLAAPLWTVLALLGYAVAIAAITSMAEIRGPARVAFVGVALLLTPIHTLVWQGQTAAPVLPLVAVACWLVHRARAGALGAFADISAAAVRRRRTDAVAGVMLGLAAVMKPQLGLVFLVYHLGRWRWRVAAWGLALVAALLVLGIARLELAGIDWFSAWRANLAAFTTSDDAAATSINPIRYHLLNLHYPLHAALGDAAPAGALTLVIVAALAVAYLIGDWSRGADAGERRALGAELASLSMCAAVTLAVAYHRIYDAVVLLFPLALAMVLARRWLDARAAGDPAHLAHPAAAPLPTQLRVGWRAATLLLWIIVLSFLGPWSVILTHLAERGRVPASLAASWPWRALIVPAQAWALLVLAALLVWMRWRLSAFDTRSKL